jgi:protoheme IX farnesyltransferase
VITGTAPQSRTVTAPLAYLRDLVLLSKPRLSTLVIITAAGGMTLAPGEIHPARAILVLLCTAAVVGAANALNCYLERDIDGKMRRTRDRPLPAGRVEPFVALALGIAVPVFALPLLALAGQPLTALLAFVALTSYVLVYTPLKQRSALALFVGAVPGAIPPVMGWTAVTGRLDLGAAALFALLFFWQLPHFLAVSLYLREDYARGGLKVFAVVHGERATRWWIVAATALLVPVSLVLVPLGLAGTLYGVVAAVLGAALLAYAILGVREGEGGAWARRFFLATVLYLTILFTVLVSTGG